MQTTLFQQVVSLLVLVVTFQAQHVGNAVNSFHVFQQVYDKSGKPIEGVVVDRNGDGKIYRCR